MVDVTVRVKSAAEGDRDLDFTFAELGIDPSDCIVGDGTFDSRIFYQDVRRAVEDAVAERHPDAYDVALVEFTLIGEKLLYHAFDMHFI